MTHKACARLAIVLSVLLTGIQARAQGNLRWGLVQIRPSLTQSGTWDNNIDLNSGRTGPGNEKRSDYINTITPAIRLVLDRPLLDLSLDLRADITRYNDHSGNDGVDLHLNLTGIRGIYGRPGTPGLYLRGEGYHADIRNPYAQSTLEDRRYREGHAVERRTNDFQLEAGYGLRNQYSVQLAYQHNYLSYKDRLDFDSNVRHHTYEASLNYRLRPRTLAQLTYGYTDRAYFDYNTVNPVDLDDVGYDSHIHNLTLGTVWDQTEKLDGALRMGYSWHRFRQSQDRHGNPMLDFSTWILDLDVEWRASERTIVELDALLQERDSVHRYFYSYQRGLLGFNVQQIMGYRLRLFGGGSYERNKYSASPGQDRSREYGVFQTSCGARFALGNWVSAGIRYTYRKRNVRGSAEFIDDRFSNHRATFTITGSL